MKRASNPEYSLWIVPPEPIYQNLKLVILHLSKCFSAPEFEPHITLLGDLDASFEDILAKTRELARSLLPFTVSLNSIGYGDEYFRCVYALAGQTDALLDANRRSRRIFHRESDRPFLPHLSLMYGYYDNDLKERAIEGLGEQFQVKFMVTSIYLVLSSSKMNPVEWKRLREVAFGSGQDTVLGIP